ncbi:MAG: DNA polymerase III subunit delta [Candidatus Moranbacteria bacterium]|nr:DNA polymerase III subunit delta [Candidatus Moranbacteria bacterium]
MIALVTGPDLYLLLKQKRALKSAFLSENRASQIVEFDFSDDASSRRLKAVFEASEVDLFSQAKCLILNQPSLLIETARTELLKEIEEKKDALDWILVEEGNLKKTELYTKALLALPGIKIYQCDVPSDDARRKIFQTILRENGRVSFAREAEKVFFERVGKDTAKLYTELEKILTYKEVGEVTLSEVELLLEPALEDTAFLALDALSRGDKKQAALLFRNALLWKKDALPILGLCVWQIRQLIFLREAYDQGIRQERMLAEASGVSPFVTSKLARVLGEFPLARLKQAHEVIRGFDTDIKRGLIDQGTAVDLLAWKI